MVDNVVNISNDEDRPKEKTPRGWQRYWSKEKAASDKRINVFLKQGDKVNSRYLDLRGDTAWGNDSSNSRRIDFSLNFFHTNIQTISSMLYGSTPRVDVSREHQDPTDDVARVAANLYQRILEAELQTDDVPTAIRAALQDRLLPGLGLCRVRYTFESEVEIEVEALEVDTESEEAEATGEVEVESVTNEEAPIDYVHWQDFRWGWARTWGEVPWISFRSWLSKEEATARFSKKIADQLTYETQQPSGDDQVVGAYSANQENNVQQAEIWEFWDRKSKKVFWFNQGADMILDAQDDPLELDNFWPCPMPMGANLSTSLYLPKADYTMAQDLYNEIDLLQSRISIITRAIKVVGVYDKNQDQSVGRMLKEGVENDLLPVDNWAMFGEKGGLVGTIQWFPVQDIVGTLATLQEVRDQTIALLYQVTGMSDIMRGAATGQYTAASTDQLKAKMGSIRVQSLQDQFANFVADLEALKAEVISKHFNEETILKQSSAQFLPQADMQLVMPAIQLMKSPDVKWRIDIRPESIAMVDYAQLKSERTEFLTAMATYIQSAQAMAKSVPGSLPIMMEMMKWGMAGFKGSDYLEGIMDKAIDDALKNPPKDEKEGQAAEQAQLIQMQIQGEMQKIQAKSQADMQSIQAKSQAELQKINMDSQANIAEFQAKGQADLQKITADLQADMRIIAAKLGADLQREEAQSTFAIAEAEVDHSYSMIEEEQDHLNTMEAIDEQGQQVRGEED